MERDGSFSFDYLDNSVAFASHGQVPLAPFCRSACKLHHPVISQRHRKLSASSTELPSIQFEAPSVLTVKHRLRYTTGSRGEEIVASDESVCSASLRLIKRYHLQPAPEDSRLDPPCIRARRRECESSMCPASTARASSA